MSIEMVVWVVGSAAAAFTALCVWVDGAAKGKW